MAAMAKKVGTLKVQITLEFTFNRIRESLVHHIRRAKTPPVPVVVESRGLEDPELREQLLDVGIRHTDIEVGDDELGGRVLGAVAEAGESPDPGPGPGPPHDGARARHPPQSPRAPVPPSAPPTASVLKRSPAA